ncbi:hypothetical protein P3T43_002536 [Paraburkholderia sp. GAS41]|jgi:hypothetical protein
MNQKLIRKRDGESGTAFPSHAGSILKDTYELHTLPQPDPPRSGLRQSQLVEYRGHETRAPPLQPFDVARL